MESVIKNREKILVTGGAGYIGSHTVVRLVEEGYEPIIVDNFSNSYPEVIVWLKDILGFAPLFYNVDCSDYLSFKKVFEDHIDITGVIHFAAFKSVGNSIKHPFSYYDNNINSLLTLSKLMKEYGVFELVFSSSCTVYGNPLDSVQVNESTPLEESVSPYGHTKLMCEGIIRNLSKQHFLKSVILRYFNPIGAHDSGKIGELPIGRPTNLVPIITQTAIGERGPLTVHGDSYNTPDGTNIRDYVHVCDVANAHIKSLEYLKSTSKSCDIFNIGIGKGTSVMEVINTFESATNQKVKYTIGPKRPGDVDSIYAETSKANELLGWNSKYTLVESLKSSWKWQQNLRKIGFNIE